MGLDVYLYRIDSIGLKQQQEASYQAFSDKAWHYGGKGYNAMTAEEKESARAACTAEALRLGLDGDGCYRGAVKIEQASELHPEHMFKIGYFRSSYNGGGFDGVMGRYGLPDLADLFEPNDQYEFKPDWEAAAKKAAVVLASLKHLHASPESQYDCQTIRIPEHRSKVQDEQEALKRFHEERKQHEANHADFRAYGSNKGDFWLDGLKVYGCIPGGPGFMSEPQLYVIVEREDKLTWYVQALEVVLETIAFVLAQPDRELYWLHWSG